MSYHLWYCCRSSAPSLSGCSSPTKLAPQRAVQPSTRGFRGPLPGSTAHHRHFAREKTQPPPRIRGINSQPSGSLYGMDSLYFYLPSAKQDASRAQTETIAASEFSPKWHGWESSSGTQQERWGNFREIHNLGHKLSPNFKLLPEPKSWTCSSFVAFPHLQGQFLFGINTWEVGEASLIFNKALQTFPRGTECLQHSERELNSALRHRTVWVGRDLEHLVPTPLPWHALSRAQKLSPAMLMIGYMIDDMTTVDLWACRGNCFTLPQWFSSE